MKSGSTWAPTQSGAVSPKNKGTCPCFCKNKGARGVTGIFFWGGKVIFPDFFPGVKCFFPVESSHFGRPKTNFRRFQKWKQKKNKTKQKKKKKKRSLPLFMTFPTSISNFPPSLFPFSFFSPQFSPLFPFYPYLFFSRYITKNFPVRSLWGGHSAPLPPACYATEGGAHWGCPHLIVPLILPPIAAPLIRSQDSLRKGEKRKQCTQTKHKEEQDANQNKIIKNLKSPKWAETIKLSTSRKLWIVNIDFSSGHFNPWNWWKVWSSILERFKICVNWQKTG